MLCKKIFGEKIDPFWVFIDMKKIVRLTESELIKIIQGVIKEGRGIDILDDLEQYLDSGCVTIKYKGDYVVVDVESPGYFESEGFDKDTGIRIKSKLRKNGFMSTGVGEYVMKLN
jgi:hypothetical protein